MGEVPMMTNSGTFITNGVQRVVVNQMHRSPGVFFDHDKGKTHASGKLLFNCRVIPNRGSWLDFEYDVKDFLYFKIDRKKKIFSSTLLLALGYTKSEIVDEFYESEQYTFDAKTEKWKTKFNPENYKAKNFSEEVIDAKTGKVVIKLGDKINFLSAKKLANDGLKDILVSRESLFGKFLHRDVKVNEEEDGVFKIGTELNDTIIQQILDANIHTLQISVTNSINKGPYLLTTILADKNNTKDEAITEIYKMLRPGEPPTIEIATQIFNNLFFSSDRYDLSDVGRVKMNSRLNQECSDKITILRNDDIIAIIHKMLDLRDGKDDVDDIDHLGNRRVRSVGELVENQARIGVYRMERAIKEKMTTLDVESAMPQDLINAKPLTVSLKDFFATSQLSQTTLRSILGQSSLDDLLSNRDTINSQLQSVIDEQTEPWGIKVSNVEVKNVDLPQEMQRALAKQAEAERERRAKVIKAQGEFEAAQKVGEAADIIGAHPPALQLRFLQTLQDVSVDKSTTTFFPIPIELFEPFRKFKEGQEKKDS